MMKSSYPITQSACEKVLNFFTIDWALESLKVTQAFDVRESCIFGPKWGTDRTAMEYSPVLEPLRFCHIKDALLSITYRPYSRSFTIQGQGRNGRIAQIMWIDEQPISSVGDAEYSLWLAKGLFHLDLLTLEVEQALALSVSHHERLEWQLEYELRLAALSQNPSPPTQTTL